MDYYMTHSFHYTKPKNRKAAEMIEIAKNWNCMIIDEKIGYDAFMTVVDYEIRKLNEKYPKQDEILRCNIHRNLHLYVKFQNSMDSCIFQLSIDCVNSVFSFSEVDTRKCLLQPERTLEVSLKPGCC